jgi:general secretion pathway protein D
MQGRTRILRGAHSGDPRSHRGLIVASRHALAIACGALLIGATSALASGSTPASGAGSTSHSITAHSAAPVTTSRENDVTLDFVSADINDVLKALAVQSGANIVSSTEVKGTITVSLSHVTLEQALDMVARLSGYQYAKVNNTYVVGTPHGIESFSGPGGSSAAPQVTEVVALHYATVDDASGLIKTRFPDVQVSAGQQINDAKLGTGETAILLTGPQDVVDQAKQLVDSLESSLSDRVASESTETYMVKYAVINDLIGILNTLVPSLVVTPGPGLAFNQVAPSASAAASSSSSFTAGSASTGSTSGTTYSPGSGSSSGSSSSSSSSGSGSGVSVSAQLSQATPRVLLLTGTAADIGKARDILAKVDVKPAQLLYETKVTEISDDNKNNIGLNWNFTGASETIGETTGKSLNVLYGKFARTPISDLATVTLDALISDGKAKVLADPNIGAIDGYPAYVFIGDTLNYIQSITSSTTGENITTASVQVGITLRVTGKLSNDGYITLNIHPEVSTVSQWVDVTGGGELPDIATRYADTTIRVKDGETIAIGGLIQDQDLVNLYKVPVLGDLPFFGQLFRDRQDHHTKDEVVFFLKTSVMKDS